MFHSNYFKLDHAGLSHRCPELIQCYIKWFCGGGFILRNSRSCCLENICGIVLGDWKTIYLTITSNPAVLYNFSSYLNFFFFLSSDRKIFLLVFFFFYMTRDWNCSEFIYVFSMVRNWAGSLVWIIQHGNLLVVYNRKHLFPQVNAHVAVSS